MKKSVFILLIFNSFVLSVETTGLFNEANEFYVKKNYEKSAELYEFLLENGYADSQILYNLGNSYYRLNKLGQAIWAYRNAIKFSPRDDDIAHNLKIAEAQRIDRIVSPPLFIFYDLYINLKSSFTIFELSLIGGILLVILSLIWIVKRSFDLKSKALKNIFQLTIVATVSIHVLLVDKIIDRKKNESEAVIIEKVDAMSSPSAGDNKILFYINEGAVVEVLDEINQWMEIILIDGKKGWVSSNALRKMQLK